MNVTRNLINDAIRGNNKIWFLMYYDELVDSPYYQLTFLQNADLPFYNCAHALNKLSPEIIKEIEQFYITRNYPPSFYLDPNSPTELGHYLVTHGYHKIDSETENWYGFDLSKISISSPKPDIYLKYDASQTTFKQISTSSHYFSDYIKIDMQANQTPKNIENKFIKHIKEHTIRGADNYFFLGLINEIPIVTCSVGIYKNLAFLAEGAVLPEFSRRGLYSYMLSQSLLFAQKKRCKYAFFTCNTEAYSNNAGKKVGFELTFKRYYYRKE